MSVRKQPILLNHGISNVVTLGTGGRTVADHPYTYLVGDISDTNGREVKGIYTFVLPFKTDLHLVGIPKGEDGNSWIRGTNLEQVVLEGNYQDYFTLYAEEGQQSLSRYHVDPQVMVFNIDFCKNIHWEIVNNALYILDEELLTSLDIADEFIRLIKPAFSLNSPQEMRMFISQLGEDLKDSTLNLNCPVCSVELMKGKNWLACPEGHGYLLSGTEMLEVRKGEFHVIKRLSAILGRPPKVISKVTEATHGELFCPHCAHPMKQTKYQLTEIVLDICTYCPYRWVDGTELDTVLGKYRHESY